MSNNKLGYIGVLNGADSNLTKLKLKFGFKFNESHVDEFIGFLTQIDIEKDPIRIRMNLWRNNSSYHTNRNTVLYVSNDTFTMDVEKSYKDGIWPPPEMREYQDNYESYLDNIFKVLRLVKRVYIHPFAKYYYYVNDKGENESIMYTARFTKSSTYKVNKKDIALLQHYIDDIDIMNLRSYLQLALDNYDMSFNSGSIVLGFLAIINGMEALLLKGMSEKAFHLSRNMAVLLGKNCTESKKIFSDIKDLYNKRSKIVHEGRLDVVADIDYQKALRYLSKAILACISLGKDKMEIINLLDSIGYGQINLLFGDQ